MQLWAYYSMILRERIPTISFCDTSSVYTHWRPTLSIGSCSAPNREPFTYGRGSSEHAAMGHNVWQAGKIISIFSFTPLAHVRLVYSRHFAMREKKCDMWKDILGWLKLLKVSNSQGYHKRQLISCLALEKTPKTGPSPNIGDHLTDGHFDSFLSLLLRTIAITDQNVGFELLAVVESSLQTLNSSFKMIRADFSNLTFLYSSCALQEAVTSGFIVRMARLCSVSMLQSQPLCCIRLGAWGGRLNSRLQWDSSRKRRTM